MMRALSMVVQGVVLLLASCCGPPIVQGWGFGTPPPRVVSPAAVGNYIRGEPGPRITPFVVWTGWISTPFKRLGFWGWNDTGWEVRAEGVVVAAARSTDGFVTIDLQLEDLKVQGQPVLLPRCPAPTSGRRFASATCPCPVSCTTSSASHSSSRARCAGIGMGKGGTRFTPGIRETFNCKVHESRRRQGGESRIPAESLLTASHPCPLALSSAQPVRDRIR